MSDDLSDSVIVANDNCVTHSGTSKQLLPIYSYDTRVSPSGFAQQYDCPCIGEKKDEIHENSGWGC